MKRNLRQRLLEALLAHTLLVVLAIIFAVPFLWLVSTSLKPARQIFVVPPEWIPDPFTWSNYPDALTYIPFFRYMGNTFYIALFNVVALTLSSSFIAYGFSRIRWPGRDIFFSVVIATLMIPYAVTLIPTFLIFRRLDWVGTYNPLTLPALFGDAFSIFLLRQFYLTIPHELSEAARIDGASEYGIYGRIILQLAKPALATVALFTFMANWNDLLGPLIYLSDKNTYTLALGMNGFFSRAGTEWALLMAASTVMIMPIIVLFFFAQRTFIQGVALSGIKG
jgi:multiple sugar transport system permease protein